MSNRNRPHQRVQIVAAASPSTWRRQVAAIDALVTRLGLLVIAGVLGMFLLVTTNIAQVGAVGLLMVAVLAGGRAAVRAFRRSWKGAEVRRDQLPR